MNQDFRDMLNELSAEGADFLVVGAYALAIHGVVRATGDIDFWVRPTPENALKVYRALARFGAPLIGVVVEDFQTPGTCYQIGVEPRRIDILTAIDGISFEDAWSRRITVELDGITVSALSRDDFITNKRAAGRGKDQVDLALLQEKQERGKPREST